MTGKGWQVFEAPGSTWFGVRLSRFLDHVSYEIGIT